VGDNAVGKTNILEALFILSTGKSFKTSSDIECIQYNKNLTRIIGDTLEVVITNGDNNWQKKKLMVNGVPKRQIDFAGNFKVVLFGPWDMDLVTDGPSLRRKFLDTVLSQTDREYRRSILSYEKGVRQRNRLLWRIREEGVARSQLLFWNQLLIKNGNYITDQREKFINNTNKYQLQIPNNYQLQYDRSVISEGRLEQYAREEVASATTLVGPHRDDFIFFDGERKLDSYGSRGEQRMGVLWLKMAELKYIEEMTGDKPTLLLDDIFSELDHEHRKIVLDTIVDHQVIMTTADKHYVPTVVNSLQFSVINL
jgi:DNA replication and repair protein RecF